MLEDLSNLLPLALGVTISPIPIAAVILVMMSANGVQKGWAFLIGWTIGLIGILTVASSVFNKLSIAGAAGETGNTAAYFQMGFGVTLIILALRLWLKRPRKGEVVQAPGWMQSLNRIGFLGSLGVGLFLVVANVKNLPISVSAASMIASHSSKWVSVCCFTMIASLGVLVPVVVNQLGGEKTAAILQKWKLWLNTHNSIILAGLFLIIGISALIKGLKSGFL